MKLALTVLLAGLLCLSLVSADTTTLQVGETSAYQGSVISLVGIDQGEDAAVFSIQRQSGTETTRLDLEQPIFATEDLVMQLLSVQRGSPESVTIQLSDRIQGNIALIGPPVSLILDQPAKVQFDVVNTGEFTGEFRLEVVYPTRIENAEPQRSFTLAGGQEETHYLRFIPRVPSADPTQGQVTLFADGYIVDTQLFTMPAIVAPQFSVFCELSTQQIIYNKLNSLTLRCTNNQPVEDTVLVDLTLGSSVIETDVTLGPRESRTFLVQTIPTEVVRNAQVVTKTEQGQIISTSQQIVIFENAPEDLAIVSEPTTNVDGGEPIVEASSVPAQVPSVPTVVVEESSSALMYVAGILILIVALLCGLLVWQTMKKK